MRLLSLLVTIFVISAVSIALPAAPAQADEGPYITLSPDDGVPGIEARVRGGNFTADEWVDIYYDGEWIDDVKTDGDGDFSWVTFEVPESHTGPHTVLARDESDQQASETFTAEPGLTIDPDEGPVGTTVTVEGHGFGEEEENIEVMYYPNGSLEVVAENIEADEDGYWERSFLIPPSAQGHHDVDAEGDDSQDYEVEDATFEVIPEISLDKSSGSVGESVTMTGTGFEDDDRYIEILFAGEETETDPEIIRADENGFWEASFKVPQMPTGEYSVTAEGEYTKDVDELSFELEAGLVLSPDEGHVGMNLTVAGRGFASDEDVDITYDDIQVETVETDDNGSFNVTILVPESKHGAHNVTAEDDEGNSATAIFTMESAAPDTPELVSPPDGDRVGFTGKVSPTFEWSEISDDSGIYYSLQIATSDNVTSTGEFADPIFTVDGVVAMNYTLEDTEALPYGTYYWTVQAVDGADNESGWTEPYSLRAGALPLWAFIVIIVAAVGGIGALVYFRIIRQRIYYY
jgi:hypothetical protein